MTSERYAIRRICDGQFLTGFGTAAAGFAPLFGDEDEAKVYDSREVAELQIELLGTDTIIPIAA